MPYTSIDLDSDPRAAWILKGWNREYASTPTLDIRGLIATEPSDEELAELLGLVEMLLP